MKKAYLYQSEFNGIPTVRLYIKGFCVGTIDKGDVYLYAKYEGLAKKLCKLSKRAKIEIELQEGADRNFSNIRCLYKRYLELLNTKECKK